VGDLDSDDAPLLLSIDTLKQANRIRHEPVDTERLHEARARLIEALADNGPMTRAALI
jgi:hypothetical protein